MVFMLLTVAACCCLAQQTTPDPSVARPGFGSRVVPQPSLVRVGSEQVQLSGGVVIFPEASAAAPARHAAEYLRAELHRRLGIDATVASVAPVASDRRVRVILGFDTAPALVSDMPAAADVPVPGPDGYVVHVSAERRLAVVAGMQGLGIIRGAWALAQWAQSEQGAPVWQQALLVDTPETRIRMTRSIVFSHRPPAGMDDQGIARAQLDWWTRWGLNHTFLPSDTSKDWARHETYAKWYIREAHDRGMKVGANLGGRSLCASDTVAMDAYLVKARHLLALGCDFVSVLFDDLPSTRTGGHCERCVERFGASLAREQRQILESLQEVVESFGPDRKLIWCPTYYSLGMTGYRNAAEGPEAYFQILGNSPGVRRAWMYHCAFDAEFNEYLDRMGLSRRVWWYNGIRTPYYMVSREFDGFEGWGRRLVIPGLKDFQSFFSPFENGWLMPNFASADPSQHPCVAPLVPASRDAGDRTVIPQASWDELRRIGRRTDGVYYCGGTTPYHIALCGVFAANPSDFEARQAADAVMETMFGAAGAGLAARWQEAYAECQMMLARAEGQPLGEQPREVLLQSTSAMGDIESQLRDIVRRDATALPRPILDALLDEMAEWRQKIRTLAAEPAHVAR